MTRFLLDTHLLLWSTFKHKRLSNEARGVLEEPANQLSFSTVSLWEITIKRALGRPDFQFDPRIMRRALLDSGYKEVTISSEHAMTVGTLPLLHKDPFDRLLLAQALVEGLTLLTVDKHIAKYSGPIHRVA